MSEVTSAVRPEPLSAEIEQLINRTLDAEMATRARPSFHSPDPEIVGAIRAYGRVMGIIEELWGEEPVWEVVDRWEKAHGEG